MSDASPALPDHETEETVRPKHPGGRPTLYDPAMCERAIECGKEGMSIAEIASNLGVSKTTAYSWMERHPEFLNAMKEAGEFAQAWWESNGRKSTFASSPSFNATAFIFNMKNRFREDWADVRVTEDGPNKAKADAEYRSRSLELIERLGLAASDALSGRAQGRKSESELPGLRALDRHAGSTDQ